MTFLREKIGGGEIQGLDVLEVGSQNVNGSPREVFKLHGPKRYVGVDFAHGKGVDLVMDVSDLTTYFGPESFDVVVSTEMLEHAQSWRVSVDQMKDVLRPGGLLVLTARGPGFPYHGYPHDYWRFTIEDFREIFADMKIEVLEKDEPEMPGVLLKARKRFETGSIDLSSITVQAAPRS
jgi:SAM-dependent methyltransferase